MTPQRIGLWLYIGLVVLAYLSPVSLVSAQETAPSEPHTAMGHVTGEHCRLSIGSTLENIQIETADIHLHEQLFESVLRATLVQRLDHPQTDRIRAYCLRHLLVVIRQDLRTPRPTGWVQVNFVVSDVAALHQELEATARTALATLDVETRDKIVRFRLKPGVMRNHRRVDRLEVYGPEGFLIGFDQPHQ
ncbi:MAG TPA: hypothetical protein VN647_08295 [Nitrospira sp.]|nr:hypothetical protein [Nitrospira sp.]